MFVTANEKRLFKNIASNKREEMYQDITNFVNDVHQAGKITDQIRHKYRTEKLKSTQDVFKFRLSSGYRCLFKFMPDNSIFPLKSEIALLEVTEHDEQGDVGRRLDKQVMSENRDIISPVSEPKTQSTVDDTRYQRFIPMNQPLSVDALRSKLTENDNQFLYHLHGTQSEALETPGPMLLMGSAGSGKTLVEIAKALNHAHDDCRQLYITFTPMLKEAALRLYQQYENMPELKGETTFYDLSTFMLDESSLNDVNFMSFERFLTWLKEENHLSRYDYLRQISPIDLWTEIRGIIKGYAGNYYRNLELNQLRNHVDKPQIKEWMSEGLIEKQKGSQSNYRISDVERFFFSIEETDQTHIKALMQHQDLSEPLIDLETYLHGLSDKYSMFDVETKRHIYQFVETIYQPYLKKHQLVDDNDLALLLRQKIAADEILPYDYIYIDEVQDLSEVQILSLIELADTPSQVMMTGDVSQIINPTLFVKGRVGALYKQRFKGINLNADVVLNQNYRNGQRILDIITTLLSIRQEKLGTYTDDINEVSKAEELLASTPFLINSEKNRVLKNITFWLNVPNVAIIVSDIMAKKRLKAELEVPIEQETNIFTVQEVKGREFSKAILYNIVTDEKDVWDNIMDSPKVKDKAIITKYMYYFNLLYVAMTRAKYNVFIYEDKETQIISTLKPLFEIVDDNLETLMNIQDYDTEENRREQAKKHFNEGDYERAMTMYWQLDDSNQANICKAYRHIQKGEFEQGVLMLYHHNEHLAYALRYTEKLPIFELLIGYKLASFNYDYLIEQMKNKKINEMLKPYEKRDIYYTLLNDAVAMISDVQKEAAIRKINQMKEGM